MAANNDTPKWLDDLVRAKFDIKEGVPRDNQKNLFCVECGGEAITGEEMKEKHERHSDVLQARKCSRSYGLLQSDLQKLEKKKNMDIIKGVAFTVNNSKKLIFTKPNDIRNPLGSSKQVRGQQCVTCKRSIKEECIFCSILCKLEHSRKDNDEAVEGVGSDDNVNKQEDGSSDVNQERNDRGETSTMDAFID